MARRACKTCGELFHGDNDLCWSCLDAQVKKTRPTTLKNYGTTPEQRHAGEDFDIDANGWYSNARERVD